MIEIVQFEPTYQSGVVSVILPIQQEEFGINITLEDQPDLLDIPGFYQRNAGNFWLALGDGAVVGTIALLDIGNGQGALRKMFVKAPFRGARYGVALRLLEILRRWCEGTGVREVFLGTTATFFAAHRFYEKNGFTEVQRSYLPEAFPIMAVDSKFYRSTVGTIAPNQAPKPTGCAGATEPAA